MRQSIGSVWLFGLVITFILIFTTFLVITINYAKSQKLKNEIINFIEREEGFTSRNSGGNIGSEELINNYLREVGQEGVGRCPLDEGYKGINIEENIVEDARNRDYHYCIRKVDDFQEHEKQRAYYDVIVFVELNLPIIGDILTYDITGTTSLIQYPADHNNW